MIGRYTDSGKRPWSAYPWCRHDVVPAFAEVFVYVHPKGRGRGWGKSVVSACTAGLLEERRRPLYMVREANQASIMLAEGLGYVDTGARELTGECQLK